MDAWLTPKLLNSLLGYDSIKTFEDQRLAHSLSLLQVNEVLKESVDWPQMTIDEYKKQFTTLHGSEWYRNLYDDEWCRTTWRPRNPQDLSIRITRFRDLAQYAKRRHIDLTDIVSCFNSSDYIWLLNVCWSYVLTPNMRPLLLTLRGCDLKQFINSSKFINNWLKTHGPYDFDVDTILEFGALTGYRFLDAKFFDEATEARKLVCKNDMVFNFPPGTDFKTWADLTRTPSPAPKWLSFASYVQGFINDHNEFIVPWLTSGSSSKGYMYYEVDGKMKKFKARKNLVPYVYDLVALTDEARHNAKQENWTVIKNELGKVRLAVSSDILTYLQQSWLLYLTGNFYKNWVGSSLGETLDEEENRLYKMMNSVQYNYSLPWDFDGFDHQPTQDQLIYMAQITADLAYQNFPVDEVLQVGRNMVTGFTNSTLTVKKLGLDIPVVDGLLSGLRYTSLFGNQWNTIMTKIVVYVIERYTGQLPKDIQIRGDDTSVTYHSHELCEIACALYEHIGAKGGVGKFSVRYNNTEFLRQHIYPNRISGYLQRSIPGLVQRKPWNPEPWTPTSSIQKVVDTVHLLTRRGADSTKLAETLCGVWCQKLQLPLTVCRTPKYWGGLELLDNAGEFVSLEHRLDKPLKLVNLTQFGEKRWSTMASKLDISVSPERLAQLAYDDVVNMVSADDVPTISRLLRSKVSFKIKKLDKKTQNYIVSPYVCDYPDTPPSFGKYKRFKSEIASLGTSYFSEVEF